MDIMDAYQTMGSYRGAAVLCGTTHKTVKRVVERRGRGQEGRRAKQPLKVATVVRLIEERVRQSDGRISVKRLRAIVKCGV